jgi:hypothetical protein
VARVRLWAIAAQASQTSHGFSCQSSGGQQPQDLDLSVGESRWVVARRGSGAARHCGHAQRAQLATCPGCRGPGAEAVEFGQCLKGWCHFSGLGEFQRPLVWVTDPLPRRRGCLPVAAQPGRVLLGTPRERLDRFPETPEVPQQLASVAFPAGWLGARQDVRDQLGDRRATG